MTQAVGRVRAAAVGIGAYGGGMSIRVELEDLRAATGEYGWAYLLTVRDDERAHVVAVTPEWHDDALVMRVGRGTAANAAARPNVSLCYPPTDPAGYSLIVDGDATVGASGDDATVSFAPTGAVWHRPAPAGFAGAPTGCASDCLPVTNEPG